MRNLLLWFLGALLLPGAVSAQDAGSTGGFSGFLHRADAAVSNTANRLMAAGHAAGTAPTAGAYYRPISPADQGQIVNVFSNYGPTDVWPRVAVRFTRAGANLACWTAEATIFKSPTQRTLETFQICDAPVSYSDAMGQQHWLAATDTQVRMSLDLLQNIEGFTHVNTALNGDRDGPAPPDRFFNLGPTSESGTLADQYAEIIVRLMWLTGWVNHTSPEITHNTNKMLWITNVNAQG